VKIKLAGAWAVWFCLPRHCNWNENLSPALQNQRWLVRWRSCCCCPPWWPLVRLTANPITRIARNRATNVCSASSRTARSSRLKPSRHCRETRPCLLLARCRPTRPRFSHPITGSHQVAPRHCSSPRSSLVSRSFGRKPLRGRLAFAPIPEKP